MKKQKIKRSIRLKEFVPNSTRVVFPSETYVQGRDGLSVDYGYILAADKEGFLTTKIPVDLNDSTVFIAGASSIENSYCDIDKRIAFRLQKLLLDNGQAYQCLSMGVSGSTSLNLLNSILNKLIGKSGDLFFFIPSNDYESLDMKEGYLNKTRYYANILPVQKSDLMQGYFLKNKNQIISILKLVKLFCDEYGIRLFVSGVVFKKNAKKASFYSDINLLVQKFCRENSINYLDISDYPDSSFYDDVHLTEIGSGYLASRLFDVLASNKAPGLIGEAVIAEGEEIFLTGCDEVSVYADVEALEEVEDRSFLFYVQCDCSEQLEKQFLDFGMRKSSSLGFYQYIKLPEVGKRLVMQKTFKFPNGLSGIGIGFKKWRGKDRFIVHSVKVVYRVK
nr:hypothetical protein [Alcaligenes faecalis]